MDKLMESCEHENADNVDANPYNKRVPQRVRVARVKVLTKPDKHLFLFPLYEDTGNLKPDNAPSVLLQNQ